jgi:hypothetical protein
MRVRRALLAFSLLLSGCATAGGERVHVGIWNDSLRPHTIRIEIDGHALFYGVAAIPQTEPSIVADIESRLPPGRHNAVVTCDTTTRSTDFDVRRGTRTNLYIHVQPGAVTLDVAYGNRIYI